MWSASFPKTEVPTFVNLITKDIWRIEVCFHLKHDNKSFIYQNRKAWSQIHGICTALIFPSKPRPTEAPPCRNLLVRCEHHQLNAHSHAPGVTAVWSGRCRRRRCVRSYPSFSLFSWPSWTFVANPAQDIRSQSLAVELSLKFSGINILPFGAIRRRLCSLWLTPLNARKLKFC